MTAFVVGSSDDMMLWQLIMAYSTGSNIVRIVTWKEVHSLIWCNCQHFKVSFLGGRINLIRMKCI